MASSSVSKASLGAYQLSEKNPRDAALINEVKLECRNLCKWERETFPGSQPVSLTRVNLLSLTKVPYVACEKSDGERHMMLVYKGDVFIVDRMFNIYRITLSLPDMDKVTLLDGELIMDANLVTGKAPNVRYLVYDAVHVRGRSVANETLLHRLRAALLEIIRPRTPKPNDSFDIFVKDFFDVCHSSTVVFPFGQRLRHECDGLIFTPVNDAYKAGTCSRLLKWKPAHMNTVDFVLDLVMGYEPEQLHAKLLVAFGGVQKNQAQWLARSGPMWNWLVQNRKEVNGKVAECGWDPEAYTFVPNNTNEFVSTGEWVKGGGWVLHRIRDDRTVPNDESVVEKVKASIHDAISIEHLHATLRNVPPLKIPGRLKRSKDHHVSSNKHARSSNGTHSTANH